MKHVTILWMGEDPDGNPFPVAGKFKMDDEALAALVVEIEAETEVEWS
jgi:hypothetical protein